MIERNTIKSYILVLSHQTLVFEAVIKQLGIDFYDKFVDTIISLLESHRKEVTGFATNKGIDKDLIIFIGIYPENKSEPIISIPIHATKVGKIVTDLKTVVQTDFLEQSLRRISNSDQTLYIRFAYIFSNENFSKEEKSKIFTEVIEQLGDIEKDE